MLQDFLKQCFHKDPSQRPSAEVLCEHPWLKNNWDALQVCLDLTRDMLQALNPLGFGYRIFDRKTVYHSSDESALICRSRIWCGISQEWILLTHPRVLNHSVRGMLLEVLRSLLLLGDELRISLLVPQRQTLNILLGTITLSRQHLANVSGLVSLVTSGRVIVTYAL